MRILGEDDVRFELARLRTQGSGGLPGRDDERTACLQRLEDEVVAVDMLTGQRDEDALVGDLTRVPA